MLAPSFAEEARSALAVASTGSLATLDVDGRPVVGPIPIVDDGAGGAVTVLSNLTTHTMRAVRDSRAGLGVADRLLLQGELVSVPGLQQLELQGSFIARHPTLAQHVESLDFSWFRLVPERVRWIDDDGNEQWLQPADLAGAEPDPLADLLPEDIAAIGERLGDELLLVIRALGGRWLARGATLSKVDRYGIVATVDEPGRRSLGRVPFPQRLDRADEMHASLAALVHAARNSPSAKELDSQNDPATKAVQDANPELELAAQLQQEIAFRIQLATSDDYAEDEAPDVDARDENLSDEEE